MGSSGGTTGTAVTSPTGSAVANSPARTYNQLPLDTWRRIIGYHPWHFWQFTNTLMPITSSCNTLVYQYAWQDADAIGRSEIAKAIETAEARLAEYLGYFVGRHFVTETLQYPRPMNHGQQYAASIGGDGRWLNVRLNEGMIRNIGAETYSLVEAGAAVTLSDEDGDGVNETFTVTAGTALTDASELGIYFASADRLDGDSVSEAYRILPVGVTISAGVVTFKGRAWLLGRPIKYEGVSPAGLDPDTVGNLAQTVDIYRRWCDPDGTTNSTAQAVLVWETAPYPAWAIGCDTNTGVTFTTNAADPAAVAYGLARVGIRDARLGEVTIGRAVYDSDQSEWIGASWGTCRQPDRVIIRYEAGAKISAVENTLNQARIDGRWDNIIARLAAAEMTRRICACDTANQELYRWQFDLARAAGANDEQYRVGDRAINNPLGTRAGAVYAWERIQHLAITHAFNI